MKKIKNFPKISNYLVIKKESLLLLISSILLGIWAVKETIALRNILIISGSLVALHYIISEIRNMQFQGKIKNITTIPISLIFLAFIWVVFHFLFFSINEAQQKNELMSTWIRSFLSAILGYGTGLSMRNQPLKLNYLWIGILVAILVLFKQYIPLALDRDKLLVPEYSKYLFHLKINTVMMGSILLAGVNSALWDSQKQLQQIKSNFNIFIMLYFFVINVMVLWTFVFIVDSRNGIALSISLYFFWFFCSILVLVSKGSQLYQKNNIYIFYLIAIGFGLGLIFVYLQTSVNTGWKSFFDDVLISVQIDTYQHWRDISKFGVPQRENGQSVVSNTYERLSLAVVGLNMVMEYPLGVGVLKSPILLHSKVLGLDNNLLNLSTHSGWIELGLAFGWPMLGIIFGCIGILILNLCKYQYPAKITASSIIFLIFFLYLIGEVAIQHGLEIFFYLLAFISGLIFKNS